MQSCARHLFERILVASVLRSVLLRIARAPMRRPGGESPMLMLVRAGLAVALMLLPVLAAAPAAAEKAFTRDNLSDAAVKLEAKIKGDAGRVAKPLATLKRDADAAFQRNDVRGGL